MSDTTAHDEIPRLVYDGECGFCERWVARWRSQTQGRVIYEPYQGARDRLAGLTEDELRRAVHLIEPGGRVTRGAQAVFRAWSYAPGSRGFPLRAYRYFPGFAAVSEAVYRLVAGNRRGFSVLSGLLWGPDPRPSSYLLAAAVFLRLLGVVYLIAFVSLWTQVHGLIGSRGVLPVAQLLEAAQSRWGLERYWILPTLCWFNAGDVSLHLQCGLGVAASVLLMVNVAPVVVLVVLWFLYLSLTVAGQVFLSFQWDVLLLEAGFLAVFLAPLRLVPRPATARPPPGWGVFLQRFLLFKLMFLSGVTKLLSGDPTWRGLTALDFHYQTQPIPIWTSWYAHALPAWFGKTSVAGMFVIELAVPFLIFGPRRVRHLACVLLVLFQALIAATGNYGFFNLLTAVLCVLLLDDRLLRRFLPGRLSAWVDGAPPLGPRHGWRHVVCVTACAALLVISGLALVREMVRSARPDKLHPWVVSALDTGDSLLLSWAGPLVLDPLAPLRTINGYGLFRVMTTQRPEIVVEGSRNGWEWRPYGFRWKPGDLKRRPRFVAPHQPRLDWQMWFAALSPRGSAHWLGSLMQRLLEGSPAVLGLLEENPFPGQPPRYIRLVYYRYRFTTPAVKRDTGAWWRRYRQGVLTRPVSLP